MVESGRMGRVAYARIAPNEDLVLSVEKLCALQGFRNAFVRGALGSLSMPAWRAPTAVAYCCAGRPSRWSASPARCAARTTARCVPA